MKEESKSIGAEYWDLYDENRVFTGKRITKESHAAPGEYRLIAHVWIKNKKGQWLITQRSEGQPYAGWWEPTSGSVRSGETTLDAALREAREEIGIELSPSEGKLFRSVFRPTLMSPNFCDMWVFEKDFPLSDITFQPEETCDALWATREQILSLMERGIFMVFDMEKPIKDLLFSV